MNWVTGHPVLSYMFPRPGVSVTNRQRYLDRPVLALGRTSLSAYSTSPYLSNSTTQAKAAARRMLWNLVRIACNGCIVPCVFDHRGSIRIIIHPFAVSLQVKSGFLLNVICIVVLQLSINTWGYSFFKLGEYPAWADSNGQNTTQDLLGIMNTTAASIWTWIGNGWALAANSAGSLCRSTGNWWHIPEEVYPSVDSTYTAN